MKFGKSMSVVAFKEMHKAETLSIKENPKTNKLFVTANGSVVAAVSKNYDKSKDKEFVELIMEDTGETLWCLHNPSAVNTIESF